MFGSLKTRPEARADILPRNGPRRIAVVFRQPALDLGNLRIRQGRHGLRGRDDTVPKVFGELNAFGWAQCKQLAQD